MIEKKQHFKKKNCFLSGGVKEAPHFIQLIIYSVK